MKETLKALREKFNYSQNSVAQFLGISRQMYIKYESGEVEPPVKVVVALSGLYKVPYEILIDNKVVNQNEKREVEYKFHENEGLAVADPGVEYSASRMYYETVISMFKKMVYVEQLKVFAELAGEIQRQSDEMANVILETKREKDPLQNFFELGNELHGNSKSWKWNREELYDREICKHRGE